MTFESYGWNSFFILKFFFPCFVNLVFPGEAAKDVIHAVIRQIAEWQIFRLSSALCLGQPLQG